MKKRTKKITIFSIIGVALIAVIAISLTNSNNDSTMVQADIVTVDDIFEKVTNDPDWIATYAPQGNMLVHITRDDFNKIVQADYDAYKAAR